MLDLNATTIFVKVVNENGFTAAAKTLGLPKQTVSRKVAELESELGVRLLERSTRRLRLTVQGEKFFDYAQQISSLALTAAEEVRATQEEPNGVLRISSPPLLGDLFVRQMILDYMNRYPKVRIETRFYLPEHEYDLLEENIDIDFRIGSQPESSLIAKRVSPSWSAFFASPDYIEKHGAPQTPGEIKHHKCIDYERIENNSKWIFQSQEKRVEEDITPYLSTSNFWLAKDAVSQGFGIGCLPMLLCAQECRAGRLVQILREYHSPIVAIYAVYPSRKLLSLHIRKFLDMLDEYRQQNPVMQFSTLPKSKMANEIFKLVQVFEPRVLLEE